LLSCTPVVSFMEVSDFDTTISHDFR
jgi:hypothetical protein